MSLLLPCEGDISELVVLAEDLDGLVDGLALVGPVGPEVRHSQLLGRRDEELELALGAGKGTRDIGEK